MCIYELQLLRWSRVARNRQLVVGVAQVYLTDRSDAADIQRNIEANIALNRIGSTTRFLALDWGRVDVSDKARSLFTTVDVLLAADCFYRSEGSFKGIKCSWDTELARVTFVMTVRSSRQTTDFEKVLASVALIFHCNPNCRLYVTYQLRRCGPGRYRLVVTQTLDDELTAASLVRQHHSFHRTAARALANDCEST